MASNIVFGGLATGLDTNSIIEKLVSIEKLPANALQSRVSDAQKRISILSDLTTKLNTLQTAAKAVDTSAELRSIKTTVTGDGLTATTQAGVGPGKWTVKVGQLARAETSRSQAFDSRDAGAAGAGSLTITSGAGSPVTVDYTASDSLTDIADRINASDSPVTASVLFDGSKYRLTVSSEQTGAANALTFDESGSGLGLSADDAEVVTARDAKIEIAGTTISRPTNTVTDVIPGVTLNLAKVTASDSDGTVVEIGKDPAGQRASVQTMVDAYNEVAKVLSKQLSYGGVQKGEDSLFGDSTLQAMQRRLGALVGSAFTDADGQVTARDLGITLQADNTLKLDAAVFDRVAAERPNAVDHLIAGNTDGKDGLAVKLSSFVDELTKSGTGALTAKKKSINDQIAGFNKSIDRIGVGADELETRLRRQYSALEQLVSGLNSNLSYLSQIAG